MYPKTKQLLSRIILKYDIKTVIFFEVAVGILLSIILLFVFLFISDAVLENETKYFDTTVTGYILNFRHPWMNTIMFAISMLGEQILIIQAIIVIFILTIRKHRQETIVFLVLLVIGVIITTFLKSVFQLPRPEEFALIKLYSYSFPSGHALSSFLFYGTLSYFTYHFTKNKTITVAVFFVSLVIVFLVGVSRVYLGVHRPSDVIAGDIVGFWLLVTVILVDKTFDYFKLLKETNDPN